MEHNIMKKTYQELEKEKNFKQILILLKKKRYTTKLELSTKLGLSIPTVTKIINEMLEIGIVFEANLNESNGGRRALVFEFIPDSLLSVGVKLELDSLQIALINLDGKIIKRKFINKNFIGSLELINILSNEIEIFLFEIGILAEKVKGIGISIPGIVSDDGLVLKVGTNFKIYNLNFEELQTKFNCKVIIENEANAAALAEFENLITKKNKNILLISIGTGIGAGIIIEGTPYMGAQKRAGEAGHITLYPHGRKCNCGNRGCWEMYCSNTAIIEEFNKEFGNIKSLKDIFNRKIMETDEGKFLINLFSENLAIGIKDLLLIFDCDKIIISGEICNYSKYIKSNIENYIFKNDIFYQNENKRLEFSSYKEDANLIGAGLLTFKDFFIL
jgi:predicted NBD/HSP70 family sugar kinase